MLAVFDEKAGLPLSGHGCIGAAEGGAHKGLSVLRQIVLSLIWQRQHIWIIMRMIEQKPYPIQFCCFLGSPRFFITFCQ